MLGQRDSIGISTAIARLRERECWRKRAPNKWIVSRYNRDRTAISFILLRFELHYAASFPVRGNLQTGGKLVPARRGMGMGSANNSKTSIPNRINCFPFPAQWYVNIFLSPIFLTIPSPSFSPPPSFLFFFVDIKRGKYHETSIHVDIFKTVTDTKFQMYRLTIPSPIFYKYWKQVFTIPSDRRIYLPLKKYIYDSLIHFSTWKINVHSE